MLVQALIKSMAGIKSIVFMMIVSMKSDELACIKTGKYKLIIRMCFYYAGIV
jgi:hypothetical protein